MFYKYLLGKTLDELQKPIKGVPSNLKIENFAVFFGLTPHPLKSQRSMHTERIFSFVGTPKGLFLTNKSQYSFSSRCAKKVF